MIQAAILFNANNIRAIMYELAATYQEDELLEEYKYMLETHGTVVLAIDVNHDGYRSLSYVVTQEMFAANNPGTQLNENTYSLL